MTEERWRPVLGWEEVYSVSTSGRVMRVSGGRGAVPGKLLKPGIDSGGYPLVVLCNKPHRPDTSMRVHQLVLEAFIGPRPKGMEARHLDGDSSNSTLNNLEWGTAYQNSQDKLRHETTAHGTRIASSKLTRQQAREIYMWAHQDDVTNRQIANAYSVEQSRVSYIKTGRNWSRATQDLSSLFAA